MVDPYGLGPTKLPLKTQQQREAIFCYNRYGPTFGAGHDLFISSNVNTNSPSCSSRLGHTYERPLGQQETFFTGSTIFAVTDYEVFGLRT